MPCNIVPAKLLEGNKKKTNTFLKKFLYLMTSIHTLSQLQLVSSFDIIHSCYPGAEMAQRPRWRQNFKSYAAIKICFLCSDFGFYHVLTKLTFHIVTLSNISIIAWLFLTAVVDSFMQRGIDTLILHIDVNQLYCGQIPGPNIW